jgi:hypothetical protein
VTPHGFLGGAVLEPFAAVLQAGGLCRNEARLQALRRFGGVEQLKEACRDARGPPGARSCATRGRGRRFVRDWRFTTAAVVILGIAIGASTAIFSLVNAVLFCEQAFAEPDPRESQRFDLRSGLAISVV